MEGWLAHTHARISSDKFFPPQIDSGHTLSRPRLLKCLALPANAKDRRALFIEGQAGQGKSTLAAQFVASLNAPFVWYQLGQEDEDPIFLATALLVALTERVPGFVSPLATQMLAAGEIPAREIQRLARILADDLCRRLAAPCHLVFDDLHMLDNAPAGLAFLKTLLEQSPPNLHFALLSRSQLPREWRQAEIFGRAVFVNNAHLAFDKAEIAQLFSDILNAPLSRDEVRRLHAATEGWPAGVLLAGHGLQGSSFRDTRIAPRSSLDAFEDGKIIEYFRSEVFSGLPQPLQRSLLKLSLLDEIPLALAESLADISDVTEVLITLLRRNFFIRSLNEQNSLLAFHALFRDFLREQALVTLSAAEAQAVPRQASSYYLAQGDAVKALRYALQGEDFPTAAAILCREGMRLLATNRLVTLRDFLDRLPQEVVNDQPWLLFFTGVIRMDTDPPTAYPCFEQARGKFVERGDEVGEMLAIAQLVHFHAAVDGRFNLGLRLLPRGEELFARLGEAQPVVVRTHLAQALAGGYSFFANYNEKTAHYLDIARRLATDHNLHNLLASILTVACYQSTFVGDWRNRAEEIKSCLPLLHSPRVNTINKAYLAMTHITILALEGDFANYQRHKELLLASAEADVAARSIAAQFFLVYDIQFSLLHGRYADALALARQGAAAVQSPHVRSQLLHFQALGCALHDQAAEAVAAARESRALRLQLGGPRFVAQNAVVLGATYVQLNMHAEAEALLDEALTGLAAFDETYLRCAAYLHRAYLKLKTQRQEEARADLALGLAGMRANGYRFLWAWLPAVMQELLAFAVREGIEADFARDLAEERLGIALNGAGDVLPLLQIQTLGRLQFNLNGARIGSEELSQALRQLVALLVSAPDMRLGQEDVQLHLWPDSPPEKSRAKFDTLLSRLRKTLDAGFAPHSAKNYLILQKGVVALQNCRADAPAFVRLARQGLLHLRKKELWRADNALHQALALWKGPFLSGTACADELSRERREDLSGLYLDAAVAAGRLRAEGGRSAEAVEILNKALRTDPTQHDLVEILYGLYVAEGRPADAAKLLRRYRQALVREDYGAEDIDKIMNSLWTRPTD